MSAPPAGRRRGQGHYLVVWANWGVAGVVPALVLSFVTGLLVSGYCGDRVDCSWGLEIILVGGAALLIGVGVVAPARVFNVLVARGAPRAGVTAWLCIGLLPVLTVFTVGYGLPFTPLLARWLALRRLPDPSAPS